MGGLPVEIISCIRLAAPYIWITALAVFIIFLIFNAVFKGSIKDATRVGSAVFVAALALNLSCGLWVYAIKDTGMVWFTLFPIVEALLALFYFYPNLKPREQQRWHTNPVLVWLIYFFALFGISGYVAMQYAKSYAELHDRSLDIILVILLAAVLFAFSWFTGFGVNLVYTTWCNAYAAWHGGRSPHEWALEAVSSAAEVAKHRKLLEEKIAKTEPPQQIEATHMPAMKKEWNDAVKAAEQSKLPQATKAATQATQDYEISRQELEAYYRGYLPSQGQARNEQEVLAENARIEAERLAQEARTFKPALADLMDESAAKDALRRLKDLVEAVETESLKCSTYAGMAKTYGADTDVKRCEMALKEAQQSYQSLEEDIREAHANLDVIRAQALADITSEALRDHPDLTAECVEGIRQVLAEHAAKIPAYALHNLNDARKDLRATWKEIEKLTAFYAFEPESVLRQLFSDPAKLDPKKREEELKRIIDIGKEIASASPGQDLGIDAMHKMILAQDRTKHGR